MVSIKPNHIAIIMDGNARWAKQKNKSVIDGHQAGADAVLKAVEYAGKKGIKYLTLFAFSCENWSRPKDEIDALMSLCVKVINESLPEFHKNEICVRFIGETRELNKEVQESIAKAYEQTKQNKKLNLTIALNYGGRQDVVQACQRIAKAAVKGDIDPDQISQDMIASYLFTKELPDPDLCIRTSNELRISNFLLWQFAYTEMYFCQQFWPDFDEQAFQLALDEYGRRQRRHGGRRE